MSEADGPGFRARGWRYDTVSQQVVALLLAPLILIGGVVLVVWTDVVWWLAFAASLALAAAAEYGWRRAVAAEPIDQ